MNQKACSREGKIKSKAEEVSTWFTRRLIFQSHRLP